MRGLQVRGEWLGGKMHGGEEECVVGEGESDCWGGDVGRNLRS